MKECIKSKFKRDTIYWTIPFSVFCLLIAIVLLANNLYKFYIGDVGLASAIWGLVLFSGIPVLLINVLKIRFVIVNNDSLKYFSFWHPFGKVLYFTDFIGKIITQESGSAGSYKVLYLVDRNNRTAFKIMGLHYVNFDEINNAIPLKKINFTPSGGQYFKLLFLGRITLKETKTSKGESDSLSNVFKILQIIGLVGVSLFVIGSILKMILK